MGSDLEATQSTSRRVLSTITSEEFKSLTKDMNHLTFETEESFSSLMYDEC